MGPAIIFWKRSMCDCLFVVSKEDFLVTRLMMDFKL